MAAPIVAIRSGAAISLLSTWVEKVKSTTPKVRRPKQTLNRQICGTSNLTEQGDDFGIERGLHPAREAYCGG